MYTTIRTTKQIFVTNPDHWLGRSLYFDNLFSGKWGDKREDGSYFIVTNPDIFEHILRYLRTGVLPVFYDKNEGHNFPLHQSLLAESKYFVISQLERWLSERKYLDAVKVHILTTETSVRGAYHSRIDLKCPDGRPFMTENRFVGIKAGSNIEVSMTPVTQSILSYYCAIHGKQSDLCSRRCDFDAKEKGILNQSGWKAEDQLRWCITQREVIYDHELCVNAFIE